MVAVAREFAEDAIGSSNGRSKGFSTSFPLTFLAIFPIVLSACTLVVSTPSPACSLVVLSADGETVFGQNLDWHETFPGCVVVNKRGVKKTILPWKGNWPMPWDGENLSWISRYGSVTLTCYGRDFIEGGMNEAGLMVDETNLTAVYPPVDHRPGVSCAQWMQYQLDNFATVTELLDHLNDLRPDGEGWHYLVADARGDCAVIEYLNGEAQIYPGDAVEVCALTNTTYRQALSHISLDTAFGGEIDIAAGNDSYARFVRIAALIRDYQPVDDGQLADYAFHILDDVSCGDTRRSVVYDAGCGRILWRTQNNQHVRWLELENLDFSAGSPTKILDVDAGGAGNASALLVTYTVDANRAIVDGVFEGSRRNSEVIPELERRELTLDRALELIARHPTLLEK